MWLSQRGGGRTQPPGAQVGTVTLAGDSVGVLLDSERRDLPVYGPGGYAWRPRAGQQVLVLKTGAEGEAPCVALAPCGGVALKPGEVFIANGEGTAGIFLDEDGYLHLSGKVRVNGVRIGADPEEGT